MLSKSRATCIVALGFLIGTCAGAVSDTVLAMIVALVIWLSMMLCIVRRSHIPLLYCCIAMIGFCGGLVLHRHALREHASAPHWISTDITRLIGVISEDPVTRSGTSRLTMEVEGIFQGETWVASTGKIVISTGKYPEISRDTRVEVVGRVEPGSSGNSSDSYERYLMLRGIDGSMSRPVIRVMGPAGDGRMTALLARLRTHLERRVASVLPEPHAGFLLGLLIGSKHGIDERVQEDFQTTGLTHIVAISGYNITLIILFVGSVLSSTRRSVRFASTTLLIVLFAIFVGASAAVVRASIMGVVGLIALRFGRTNNVLASILLSAAIMCAWNPLTMTSDIGFQLSFAAVIGVVYVSPLMSRVFGWIPSTLGMRDSLALTMSAQLCSTPIILAHFHRVSLISPIANLFVAPLIPLAMLCGFILIASCIVLPLAAPAVSAITWIPLSGILALTRLFADVPYASVDLMKWGMVPSLVWYILLMGALWFLKKRVPGNEEFPL